jgi:hypothetical protein
MASLDNNAEHLDESHISIELKAHWTMLSDAPLLVVLIGKANINHVAH